MTKRPDTHHVFMGDVTGSSKKPSTKLAEQLKRTIADLNEKYKRHILSPLTVTLGDEFQGVTDSAHTTVALMIELEFRCVAGQIPKLHYAWVEGEIETPLNTEIAHGMLGPALTQARRMLTRKDRTRPDIQISLSNTTGATLLQNALIALIAISERWKPKDKAIVLDFLAGLEVKQIAPKHDRDTSSVYRRKESLMITPYQALIDTSLTLAALIDQERIHD